MWLFITPVFSICFVGVAQLTLGRIVSVSLCLVRSSGYSELVPSLPIALFSFSMSVTNCLSILNSSPVY